MRPLPLPVKRALAKLGEDIRNARLRRRIPTTIMAARAFITRTTLPEGRAWRSWRVARHLRDGAVRARPGGPRLADLADARDDEIGLALEEERLPQRIRQPAKTGRRREVTDRRVKSMSILTVTPHLVGRLWARTRKGRESATFEYDAAWLDHRARFALEPALVFEPRPATTRRLAAGFSEPSAIPRRTAGVACLSSARNGARRARRSGRLARSAKSIICSASAILPARARCASPKTRPAPFWPRACKSRR